MLTKTDMKLIRSLGDKGARTQAGLFVVEGEKMTGELLESDFEIERLLVTERCGIACPAAETVSEKDMERISMLKTPSPCMAVVRMPRVRFSSDIFPNRLVLALDDVQDPGNMGTIIRLADWFGIADVICSEATADCFNPKVVQATMGALFRVRVHYGDLCGMFAEARGCGVEIYGTMLDGENIYHTALGDAAVVVMGNEGRGIGERAAGMLSRRLFIPPYPATRHGSESLNVAVATAVACSEFRRRQQY